DQMLAEHQTDTAPPRVVIKMGGAHILQNPLGPNGVPTLGRHAQEIAEANGMEALHIGIRAHRPGEADHPPVELFADGNEILLIDCSTFLAGLSQDDLANLSADLRRDLE